MLSLLTFMPLLGAIVIFLFVGREYSSDDSLRASRNARYVALFTTIAEIGLSAYMLYYVVVHGGSQNDGLFFLQEEIWLNLFYYKIGIDQLSAIMIFLTTCMIFVAVWISSNVKYRVREYMILFLLLETFLIGVFCALDIVLFYVFFEGVLIPMFLIIGIWGGKNRSFAAYKFFLYTFAGSLFMLLAMIAMYIETGTTDMIRLSMYNFPDTYMEIAGVGIPGGMQTLLWICFFIAFAVKTPMWPVHTWLPDAHVEAPTAGSVILASVLLKMGGYGFLRFSLPMFPVATELFDGTVVVLSVIAVLYASLIALVQQDIKKLVAYSSIAHMGIVTLGIFSGEKVGIDGAIVQMISHGFISAGMFMMVGILYERFHTRDISCYGNLVSFMPLTALLFGVLTFANISLPGTSGFVGEFLVLSASFYNHTEATIFAVVGVVLSAGYGLWLLQRVFFGVTSSYASDIVSKLECQCVKRKLDLSWSEKVVLFPIIFIIIILGFCPFLITTLLVGFYP